MKYFVAISLILILLLAWIGVQRVYQLFARAHPELGPFRKEGGGCGGACGGGACGGGVCGDDSHDR